MPSKKKRLSRVAIVLADDKERELLYTLNEIYEMGEIAKGEEANKPDPRSFARVVQLGLRHAEPDLTVEQVAALIDAPNLDYYRECVNEASFAGELPTPAPADAATTEPARVNGAPTGSAYAPGRMSTSVSESGNSGNSQREN